MDYTRNVDKIDDCLPGVSYSQASDVSNEAAVTEPVSVAELKTYGKIDLDDEDTLLGLFITAARRMCEQYTNINFFARTVTAVVNNLNGGTYLPYGPIGTISEVKDIDDNVLTASEYKITGTQFKQVQTPRYEYLSVTYTGGYTTLPEDLKNAVKEQALWLYENRGIGSIAPLALTTLNMHRRVF